MSSAFSYLLTGLMTLSLSGYLSLETLFPYLSSVTSILPFHTPENTFRARYLLRFAAQPQHVSLNELITNNEVYDHQLVSVQGQIIQPELHLDETELYIDFVFRLSEGKDSIVVYGRHDRTQGAPSIMVNQSVEVIGTFFKEDTRNGFQIANVLEAITVTPYPSPIPQRT